MPKEEEEEAGDASDGGGGEEKSTAAAAVIADLGRRFEDSNFKAAYDLFNEDVDMSWCATPMSWSSVGGATVSSVEVTGDSSCTLYLLSPLSEGQTIELSGGLSDTAGNTASPPDARLS